jgi:PIN domain-containing protein
VTKFKERVGYLASTMDIKNEVIGVPAPAMAEVLVRAGKGRAQYASVLSKSWRFQILPFDSRAAIEAAELIEKIKSNSQPWEKWAKVKFDIQIVAVAKAESATAIYSDDKDIENYAKRLKIPVVRVCDLPLPPPETDTPIEAGPVGSQGTLALAPPLEAGSDTSQVTQAQAPIPAQNTTSAPAAQVPEATEKSAAAKAAAVPPSPEQTEQLPADTRKPCECGCGEYPKEPTSRFLPGHDLRKAYKDSQSQNKPT